MIAWKFKLWRTAGAAAALGLAACGGEGGAGRNEARSEAPGGSPTASGEAGEAAIGESGGEAGEAGAALAYDGVAGDQRIALRLQHLKGFVLVAERVNAAGAPEEAGVLVSQGVLEVFDAAAAQFGSFDAAPVRTAGAAASTQSLQAAERAIDSARPRDIDFASLAVSMTDISTGLYQNVNLDGAVDPIEYQHSYGAALAARDALAAGRQGLRRRDARAYDEAAAALERFVALWPSPSAPEQPATYREVLAQSSRVRLALSPFL